MSRPPLPPELRKPRRGGKHQPVVPADLQDQRRRLRDDVLVALPSPTPRTLSALSIQLRGDEPLAEPLPRGAPAQMAALLNMPERSGADKVSQMWRGVRHYHRRAKIF